jgi:DNA-binding NarL/FixJ family response regulator
MARQAAGTARLLAGEPTRALPLLRDACKRWRGLDAVYDAVRLGRALDAVGDADAAQRELQAARATFTELGAARDLAVLDAAAADRGSPGGLSQRETEVLALVALGRSNRAIASELVISERTVERHVSNIFVKLGVSSRTEAAGFAYANGLVDPAGQ